MSSEYRIANSRTLNEPPTQPLSAQPAASNPLNFNTSTSRIREESTFLLSNFWAHGPGTHISLTNYEISIGTRGVYWPLRTLWLVLIITYVQPFVEPLFATTDTTLELQLDSAVHAIFQFISCLCIGPFGRAVADLLIQRFFSATQFFPFFLSFLRYPASSYACVVAVFFFFSFAFLLNLSSLYCT